MHPESRPGPESMETIDLSYDQLTFGPREDDSTSTPMASAATQVVSTTPTVSEPRRSSRRMLLGALAAAAILATTTGVLVALRPDRDGAAANRAAATRADGARSGAVQQAGTGTGSGTGTAAPGAGSGAASPTTVKVSVILDRTVLLTPDGRRIPLDRIAGGVVAGYQIRAGWLLNGLGSGAGRNDRSLWLVRTDGSLHPLVTDAGTEVVIAPDGRHLAWRSGDTMFAGRISDAGTAVVERQTRAPAEGAPVVHTGAAVVVGAGSGAGVARYDVWLPARGGYVPSWDAAANVRVVYGPARDGAGLLGMIEPVSGTRQPCLALLDPARNLAPVRSNCAVTATVGRTGFAVSPDGRWLAVGSGDGAGHPAVNLVDVTKAFDGPTVALPWQVAGVAVWLDDTTMLAVRAPVAAKTAKPQAGALVRLRPGVDGAGSVGEPVTINGLPAGTAIDGTMSFLLPTLP